MESLRDKLLNLLSMELLRANITPCENVENAFKNYAGPFANEIRANFALAKEHNFPLCQDTGVVEFFVFRGCELSSELPIDELLNEVVERVYREHGFRKSVVADPLLSRRNTGTNTPVVANYFEVPGKELKILFLIKGGGSENLTALRMFDPTAGPQELKEFLLGHVRMLGASGCPPLFVGIGVGGTSEKALLLSKLALFNEDFSFLKYVTEYDELANQLLEEINGLKIGIQGLGVGPTALHLRVLGYPTHIATLPVAISVDCYVHRVGKIVVGG